MYMETNTDRENIDEYRLKLNIAIVVMGQCLNDAGITKSNYDKYMCNTIPFLYDQCSSDPDIFESKIPSVVATLNDDEAFSTLGGFVLTDLKCKLMWSATDFSNVYTLMVNNILDQKGFTYHTAEVYRVVKKLEEFKEFEFCALLDMVRMVSFDEATAARLLELNLDIISNKVLSK